MKFRLITAAAIILAGVLGSCQQRQPYKGYKKSPYTIKGHRFVPMDVHPALSYKAEGIASFYDGSGGVNAIGERLRSGEYYAAHIRGLKFRLAHARMQKAGSTEPAKC